LPVSFGIPQALDAMAMHTWIVIARFRIYLSGSTWILDRVQDDQQTVILDKPAGARSRIYFDLERLLKWARMTLFIEAGGTPY
jgi:hypothetical protein